MKIVLFDLMDTLVVEPYHDIDNQLKQKILTCIYLKEKLKPNDWQVLLQQLPQAQNAKTVSLYDVFYAYKNRAKLHCFERNEIKEREFFVDFYKPETPETILKLLPKPVTIKTKLLENIIPRPEFMNHLLPQLMNYRKRKPKQLKLGIASNYSTWAQTIVKQIPQLSQLDFLFFSYWLRVRKPELPYYRAIQSYFCDKCQLNIRGKDIFFVDDRKINTDAATQLGWHTFTLDVQKVLHVEKIKLALCHFLGTDHI